MGERSCLPARFPNHVVDHSSGRRNGVQLIAHVPTRMKILIVCAQDSSTLRGHARSTRHRRVDEQLRSEQDTRILTKSDFGHQNETLRLWRTGLARPKRCHQPDLEQESGWALQYARHPFSDSRLQFPAGSSRTRWRHRCPRRFSSGAVLEVFRNRLDTLCVGSQPQQPLVTRCRSMN